MSVIELNTPPEITVELTGSLVVYPTATGGSQEFTQSVASTLWTFNHTLNRRPGIHVTDLVGNGLIVETQVTHSQAIVKSEIPITGIVYLS